MLKQVVFLLGLILATPAMATCAVDQGMPDGSSVTLQQSCSLTGITLSNNTFTCGTAGTVGAVTVSGTGPIGGATLSLSNTYSGQFLLSGPTAPSNLVVGASPAGCPTTYPMNIVATLLGATGSPFTQAETITGSSGGNPTFIALHTYYMSPTSSPPTGWSVGSDSNDGTTQITSGAHGPWATPNHSAIVCGDVIIAAPATTYPQIDITQQPGTCPSTTGGIDGNGGIWFAILLCGGASVGDCQINQAFGAPNASITTDNISNWAVEGWQAHQTSCCSSGNDGIAFTSGSPSPQHHTAFINDIATGVGDAYTPHNSADHSVPADMGSDYIAVVGMIAQDANEWGQCIGAIDIVAPAQTDTLPGTHMYVNSNIAWNNIEQLCAATNDGEAFYGDTWDAHGYSQKGVYSNNISWFASRQGLKFTDAENNTATPTINVNNNTLFDDLQTLENPGGDAGGDMGVDGGGTGHTYLIRYSNNIVYQPHATSPGNASANINGFEMLFGTWPDIVLGTTGTENIITSVTTSCPWATCTTNFDAGGDAGNSFGTNFYHENPSFANTTDLLANWLGPPNCSGFTNTTACMGWNANTSTLTANTPIADLVPSSTHSAGKGYQKPSTTCQEQTNFTGSISGGTTLTVSSVSGLPLNIGQMLVGAGVAPKTVITAGSGTSWTISPSQSSISAEPMGADDYPYWLKGIVYLHWNGTIITENADLATKPCGM